MDTPKIISVLLPFLVNLLFKKSRKQFFFILLNDFRKANKTSFKKSMISLQIEYEKAYKAYQNSVPYLNYMAAKAKSGKLAEKVIFSLPRNYFLLFFK